MVSGANLALPQGANPTYRRSFLAEPTPPHLPSPRHPRVLQTTASYGHPFVPSHGGTRTCPTARGGHEARAPRPPVSAPRVRRAGPPGPWRGEREGGREQPGRSAGHRAPIPVPVPAGQTLVERGGPRCPAPRAGQGMAGRSLPSRRIIAPPWPAAAPVGASPRAAEPPPAPPRGNRPRSRPRPPPAGAASGSASAPGARPRPGAPRGSTPGRGCSEPAGAARRAHPAPGTPAGTPGAAPPPSPLRRARPGGAARPPAPLPRAATRWHGRAADRRLPRAGTGCAAPARGRQRSRQRGPCG